MKAEKVTNNKRPERKWDVRLVPDPQKIISEKPKNNVCPHYSN